mmetsp:Transcript_34730/g.40931  ORF Transcript_34730/g.40931 Transcript_34730/m.40931 type:complete len:474 (+) Transcript_34730:78-1499(+)
MEVEVGLVLKKKWTLTKFLAKGACAEIWTVSCDEKTAKSEGRDQETGWIAKVVPEPPFLTAAAKKKVRKATDVQLNAKALAWEHTLYRSILRGHSAIPKSPLRDDFGTQGEVRFLIMERLGQNLGDYFEEQGRHFSNETLSNYGVQMLSALRQCHDKKILFVDVKPENFMLGYQNVDKIYIADFGVADKYIDSKGQHRLEGMEGGSGTPAYMSLRCHDKATMSRRDDLEALAYVLVELLVGTLPWGDASSEKELVDTKKGTDIEALCASFSGGAQLSEFCQQTRALGFADTPDYDRLAALLVELGSCLDTGSPKRLKTNTVKKSSTKKGVEKKSKVKGVEKKHALVQSNEKVKKSTKTAKVSKQCIEVEDDDDEVKLVGVSEEKKSVKSHATKKKQEEGPGESPKLVEETHATASASATVTYTYTLPKTRSKGKAMAIDDSDSDEEENKEPQTYTATVTVTATAKASHPIPSL